MQGADPLLPKRKTLFLGKLDFGSSGESVEGKDFIYFFKNGAERENLDLRRRRPQFRLRFLLTYFQCFMDDLRRPQWKSKLMSICLIARVPPLQAQIHLDGQLFYLI